MGNWSDEVTLAMPMDVPRMNGLKREWLANLEGWIDWNKAPEYTRDHYEHILGMVGKEGGNHE